MPKIFTILLGAVILAGLAFLWSWLTRKNKGEDADSSACTGNCASCMMDMCNNRKES